MANNVTNKGPAKAPQQAPNKAPAPAAATAAAPVVLATAPVHGGSKGAALAQQAPAGALLVAPMPASMGGGQYALCAPVAAQYSAGSSAPAWPPLYTNNAGTVAAPPKAPPGAGSYAVLACYVPAGGAPYYGMAHVYPGHANNTAGSVGNGAMVVAAAPKGAAMLPQPQPPAALAAWAKGKGL